ncbi:unnamed protein product [Moneuplotes crassus]|uniref:Uncharacterized protein n=1 Tax=Euplotes crassus TaxID=5936 RepID=A0AAD1UKC4_EUPCR|nr:unnamed protein product [Moneuplotes crassus]
MNKDNENTRLTSHVKFQDLAGFLKVNKSKITQKPIFPRSRRITPVVSRVKEPCSRRLIMKKQKKDAKKMDHLMPDDNNPKTILNSSTEYSCIDKEYDDIYLNSQNASDSVSKVRMKPINKFGYSSPIQSPLLGCSSYLGAHKGSIHHGKKFENKYRKQISKFSAKSNQDIFEPLKIVKRFDTDLGNAHSGTAKKQNADLL